jgi:hypothetical protein
MRCDGIAQQPVMFFEQRVVTCSQGLQKLRGTLNVGKEDGECAAWKVHEKRLSTRLVVSRIVCKWQTDRESLSRLRFRFAPRWCRHDVARCRPQMRVPNPVPPALVEMASSVKSRARTCSGMPRPVSRTATTIAIEYSIQACETEIVMLILPPRGVSGMALFTSCIGRLNIWRRSA